jgi:hypothetical protein
MSAAFARAGSAAASSADAAAKTSSDETLIRRIAGGDQLAMRTLFARHRVPLYRWLLRIVRDETLAAVLALTANGVGSLAITEMVHNKKSAGKC